MTKRNASIPVCHSHLGGRFLAIQTEKIPYWKSVEDGVSSSKKRSTFLRSLPALAQSADLPRSLWAPPLADAIDTAAINGSGSSNQPTGILNTSGIGSVAGGTNGLAPTLDHLMDLKKEVAVDNADVASCGFLTNAKVEGVLGKLKDSQSQYLLSPYD